MITIHVDGRAYEVEEGTNLLQACLSRGLDLPYFCWHPALGSVGACRQCAVKQYEDEEAEKEGRGKLVMACMAPAEDGARLAIEEQEASRFRASVIEWLMVNHPHDCPVCDEGGECHLQDMTVMTGHTYREFRFRKRTFRNQDLGPLVNHEMNRCIQCYRCVRFYEHAGGDDLQAFACHDHTWFGRHEDGPLESPFAGNLVEVCPTGVFTDKTLKRHYTRKWDLQTAPSVCVHCGLGCNTIPGERYGELRRIRNRYHPKVNGYFLCDRGRYGYEFVNHERRVRAILRPRGGAEPAGVLGKQEALQRLGEMLSPDNRVLGIGSPRASLESNFALRRLVGEESFHSGTSDHDRRMTARTLEIMGRGSARAPSLREIEDCDAVLVLGEDATNTAPLLALALRQAAGQRPKAKATEVGIPLWNDAAVAEVVQDETGPFFVATSLPTDLDELATATFRGSPEEIARLGHAVAGRLVEDAPEVPGLDEGSRKLAKEIGGALADAERPLVVSGFGAASEAVLAAAANVAWALGRSRGEPSDLFLTVPECDSLGLAFLGGGSLEEALERSAAGEVDTLVVVENDLYRRAPRELVDRALDAVESFVVMDHLAHETGARASLLFPVGTFAESSGTLVNNEGRAQRFYRVMASEEPVRDAWRWLRAAAIVSGREEEADWKGLDDVVRMMEEEIPALSGVVRAAPPSDFRIHGERVPRQLHRYSGRTAMHADRDVFERPPREDPDSALAFSMEGAEVQPPPALIREYRAPGWNSVQALNRFQEEIAGPLRGEEPGVRLLEPREDAAPEPYRDVPDPNEAPDGSLRLIPLWHVFGSEELSNLAAGVAELAPSPYLALGSGFAGELGVEDGEELELRFDGGRGHRAPVRIVSGMADGVVGVPVGLDEGWEGPLPPFGRLGGSG